MSCEVYRESLSDALLRGEATLSAALAEHVRACADCAEFYESQKQLLGAMDLGVRAMVNEKVPASLLPRVRAQREAVEPARFRSPLLPTAGVVALALLILVPLARWRARTASQQTINPDAPIVREQKDAPRMDESIVLSMHPSRERLRAAKRCCKPEVVPQEAILSAEQAAVARFASEHPEEMAETVRAAELESIELSSPFEIVPLKIERVEFAPLEDDTKTKFSPVDNGSAQFSEEH